MGMGLGIKDHLNDLLRKVAESYLDGNLALKESSSYFAETAGSDADDEDENFEKGQRTQRQEDLETYSRLLKIQIVHSLNIVLSRITHFVR